MATTASTYYNKININYPTAGRDNDSQSFRDNFTNIKRALSSTDEVVSELKLGMVTTSTVNNFGFNTIKRANLQDCSVNVYDATDIKSQTALVDYSQGSYQKFKVAAGPTNFNVINWPQFQSKELCGSVILSITPTSVNTTIVSFQENYIPVGETVLPFIFSSTLPIFFELWSDNGGTDVYVNQIGYKSGVVATGTDLTAYNSITIGTNKYTTGTDFSTVVSVDTGVDPKIGVLGVLPYQFRTNIVDTAYLSGPTASHLSLVDTSGIRAGATFNFTSTNTTYVVDTISSSSITTTVPFTVQPAPPFTTSSQMVTIGGEDLFLGPEIVFTNPVFPNQTTILTFAANTVTSVTGKGGDLKGQVYANSATLYIAHADFGDTEQNWLKIYGSDYIDNQLAITNDARGLVNGTTAVTQAVTDNTSKLATNAFVHDIMPAGAIIMWYGSISTIPTGWALCDGSVVNSLQTPNLIDRFIVGAGNVYPVNDTGGSADAVLVLHNHAGAVGSHSHSYTDRYYAEAAVIVGTGFPVPSATGSGDSDGDNGYALAVGDTTGATQPSLTINSSGESGIDKNLPPYYALCYIMKVTGA